VDGLRSRSDCGGEEIHEINNKIIVRKLRRKIYFRRLGGTWKDNTGIRMDIE
jgi:hypothetical protein